MHCTGICCTNLYAIMEDWPVSTKTPLTGRHEGVGDIVTISENIVSSPIKLVSQLYYRPVVTYCMVYHYTKRATLARLLANKGLAIYVVLLNRYFVIPLCHYLVVTFLWQLDNRIGIKWIVYSCILSDYNSLYVIHCLLVLGVSSINSAKTLTSKISI